MKNHQAGFLLITVIIMMSVLTLLISAHLKSVLLYLKRHHLYHDYQQRTVQLEAIGQRLIQHIPWQTIKPDTTVFLNDRAMLQLILKREHRVETHYRYVVADLGDYPCVKLLNTHKPASSHHWLLSIMDDRMKSRMLQLRIATPIPDQPCTSDTLTLYHAGLMTWRVTISEPRP